MADYNSPNTGVEIDAAVAATAEIMKLEQVYAGSPTNVGIPLSSLPINPGTGDRTGIYDVVYHTSAGDINTGNTGTNLSRIYIANESNGATGSSHVTMSDTDIYSFGAGYNTTGSDQTFVAKYSTHAFGSGTANTSNVYIHEIWRLEKIA